MMEFEAFPKITRYEKAAAIVTEKIDGTNACIAFTEDGELTIQSRKRIISPDALDGKGSDNYGFAHYVRTHEKKLWQFFGPGRHFGEWFGTGIQRSYGMRERVFAPFNTSLFSQERIEAEAPEGVTYTPVLAITQLADLNETLDTVMADLLTNGSKTREGAGWSAEGTMIYVPQFGYLKAPFEQSHKWQTEVAA